MSRTTAPAATLFPGASAEVLGLGAEATLAFVVEQRRRQDQAAADELKSVTHDPPPPAHRRDQRSPRRRRHWSPRTRRRVRTPCAGGGAAVVGGAGQHRDHGCRFPWCGRRGRFDADHIDEYLPPDQGGPPGQTNTHNLARLCRFHHRVKTHSDWDYRREPDGTLHWTSPHGRAYTVDEHGTLARS